MQKILTEISCGELIDKISILEIKIKKIKNVTKKNQAKKECLILRKTKKSLNIKKNLNIYSKKLKRVNLKLWKLEDDIRKKEKFKNFDKEFIKLAREVYKSNDERSLIKKKINLSVKSNIIEVKSHKGQ
jgi:hypothetical protein